MDEQDAFLRESMESGRGVVIVTITPNQFVGLIVGTTISSFLTGTLAMNFNFPLWATLLAMVFWTVVVILSFMGSTELYDITDEHVLSEDIIND